MFYTNLLANMVVLTLHGTIPTNTPAFQEYAFSAMYERASVMASNWDLALPKPISTKMVTHFVAEPTQSGIKASIEFSNRFVFSCLYGELPYFVDKQFDITKALTPDVKVNDVILEQMMRATNFLTVEKAQQIADSAMKSVGLPRNKMGFGNPLEIKQQKYQWTDGKIYPLPYYEFYWRTDKGACGIDVSGISSNLARFYCVGPYLHFEKPTNYLAMLGLPTNAVFVHRLSPPGKPPLYELRESKQQSQ